MLKNQPTQAIMHGENLLLPVSALPKGAKAVKLTKDLKDGNAYIFGHSESGHSHLIEVEVASDLTVFATADGQVYIKVDNPAKISHKKSFDIHSPIEVTPGVYKVNKKVEYNPFTQVVQQVWD